MSINGDEDRQAWLKEIESVEPLQPVAKTPGSQRSPNIRQTTAKYLKRSEAFGNPPMRLVRRKEANPMVDITPATGPVKYARSGLQKKTMDRLKQGQPGFEEKLDLHGYSRVEANEKLEQFFSASIQSGYRCLLVIHGKGHHSSETAVLKTFTMDWLKEIDAVQAFCTASQADGGTGAVYVLLKRQPR
ncbi:MAG: Smr/MutS family protein [Gammaproteobacteria bacterium]|nr:Smr/MutS family protein [Gammaproteobacteria bacterium]